MKILHIITGLDAGGAEILLLNTCVEQMKKGNKVKVIYLKTEGSLQAEFEKRGIHVEKYDIEKFKISNSLLKLLKTIKKEKFDIVHTHLTHAAFLGRIAAILAGHRALVNTIHGPEEWISKRSFLVNILKRIDAILNNASFSVVLAVSNYVRNYWLQNSRYTKNQKIITLYNAIDTQKIDVLAHEELEEDIKDFIKDKFVLSFVGRLEEAKNPFMLIHAMDVIINREGHQNIVLLIIGNGTLKNSLSQFISSMQLEKNIRLLGFRENPYKYIKNSKLMVMTSKREGMPNVVLEALYLKTPICAPALPTLMEILNYNNSLLFEEDNIEDMVRKIIDFYKGKKRVSLDNFRFEFDIENYVSKLDNIYKELLSKKI